MSRSVERRVTEQKRVAAALRAERKADKKHDYSEAFMLMTYQSDDGTIKELIWNSRDGITPFCVDTRDGQQMMQHVEWRRDEYRPDYKPPSGSRIFVNLTIERAKEKRRHYVEKRWGARMAATWASKEDAIEELAQHDMESFAPCTPDLVVVP